jgi:hypothetical protein
MRPKTRNVFFALLGAAALVLKGRYSGPYRQAVHSYGGNIVVSFATYYVVALLPLPPRFGKLLAAGLALAVGELFEATKGFGGMTDVSHPVDFAANAVGVALALAVDVMFSGISRRRSHNGEQPAAQRVPEEDDHVRDHRSEPERRG